MKAKYFIFNINLIFIWILFRRNNAIICDIYEITLEKKNALEIIMKYSYKIIFKENDWFNLFLTMPLEMIALIMFLQDI